MNVYVLELEEGRGAAYLSRRIATRVLSLTNMQGISKIEVGDDMISYLEWSQHFSRIEGNKEKWIGMLGDNPLHHNPDISGFIKIGKNELKVILE